MSSKARIRDSRPRASFVVTFGAVTLLGAGVGAATGACGGTTDSTPGDGGTNDSGNPIGCPASPPTSSTCDLPNGTSCSYGAQCSPIFYSCSNGQWARASSNPPAPQCPTTLPASGATCDVCSAPSACSYVIGTCLGQPINGQAQCVSGKWQIVGGGSCNPPAVDAGNDASAIDAASSDARSD